MMVKTVKKKTVTKTNKKTSVPSAVKNKARILSPLTDIDPDNAVQVLNRLWEVVMQRRDADPAVSHSARLLSRGIGKVAQKFGEEAVECLIEAVSGDKEALIGESADVLYHLLVLWVAVGVEPAEVWRELAKREGISGIAEKASRAKILPRTAGLKTTKIP
ncbi:Phosphoribosyl-ATP pyrophosphatase [Granulibacter bethesdensis]|uniref:Phosphoribosyl-ATP pyrophosphatase n=1 Tax=Granulibacter bethesdensis TaxID=364410 RepID=A0AAC9KCJ3_9PROT|nr:phosphoribosyl-ATP diphosphatase [Granulibacter bethesdensis]APH55554.1 Phosphoribosyl-ATP pyrophosphatase [Granulibacter bethesdensis]APH63140.1 Phosphoribosyl-ATP pyrophosphatase [Granulibacter bethesdensis]